VEPIYLALGDSTGVGVGATSGGGYPSRLARLLPIRTQLVNLCQSGATSADVLSDQLPRALQTKPRLITVGVGINDVGLQLPDEAYALNLENIVVPLRKLGAPIALLNLPDLALSPAVARLVPRSIYEKRIEMFNDHVTATAARHGLTLIDLWSLSREILPGRPELFSSDGYHPSALGYELWAARMAPAAERMLGVGVAATG
jgi:lysophospholipase L1-like esterase